MINLKNLPRRAQDRIQVIKNARVISDAAVGLSSDARAAQGLNRHSLDLCFVRHASDKPSVNVVLPHFSPSHSFAGIQTAAQVAIRMAVDLEMPLRIVSLQDRLTVAQREEAWANVSKRFGVPREGVSIHDRSELIGLPVSADDVWIATYWTTAHALDVACTAELIDRARVVYLIQDYEPGFMGWSTDFAVAKSTYHAGFIPLINSVPLARHLEVHDGLRVDDRQVFSPQVDLESAAKAWNARGGHDGLPQVFFYARPSKPRNLYAIGLSALKLAAARRPRSFRVVSAGEAHEGVDLGDGSKIESRGRVTWDGYFDLLAQSDVVLSLQHSPHPSHPPLDGLAAGAQVVTNELGGTRAGLLPGARVVEATPDALSVALVDALEAAVNRPIGGPRTEFMALLGTPFDEAVAWAVSTQKERGL